MTSVPRTKVFISYSHEDTQWLERLQVHLKRLEREGKIERWDDTRIKPGAKWHDEIRGAIAAAKVAVLLVSADFLASDFIAEDELPPLLEAAKKDGAVILPVIVSPSQFPKTTLADFQTINPPDEPLIGMERVRQEETFVRIADAIEAALSQPVQEQTTPQSRFKDRRIRGLSEALEDAYQRYETLLSAGGDTAAVQAEILDLRRQLREGGQLKAGEFLLNGRLKLLEPVGRGGFAVVWKAFDRKNRELVAVKVLHGQYAEDRSRRERLFRGARKMAALHHQSIVRVIEEELEDGGRYFFVMEYLDGGDLRQAVLAKALLPQDCLHLVAEVGDALQFAHEQGVIHRDIKPANILLDRQRRAKLTDFDLVRAMDTTGGTRTGALGTVIYAAPETMHQAQQAGVPADIYGLGMTAVFSVYGAELPLEVFRDAPRFIQQLEVPTALKQVLEKAVAWDWRDRHGSVADFCQELRASLLTSSEPIAEPVPRPTWAEAVGRDEYGLYADFSIKGVHQRMRWIEPGEFLMGSPESEAERDDDEIQHRVVLTRGFWLADTACTQGLWQAVMGGNPSGFKGEDRPVENVSWEDVQKFIDKLNVAMPGEEFRLPTEAEWEYACRAGTTSPFWFGDQITPEQVNYDGNYPYAGGKKRQYREETVAVKALPCNSWGLYQMHGNVWEWCQDWYGEYDLNTVVDPTGSAEGADRVLRGGGWFYFGGYVRSAFRYHLDPGARNHDFGLRLARGQASGEQAPEAKEGSGAGGAGQT